VSFLAFLNADKTKEHCMSHHDPKIAVDAISLMTVVGTLVDVLPSIAALISIVWGLIRIWETDTVKSLTGRKNAPVE
jgi:hypothetical protein